MAEPLDGNTGMRRKEIQDALRIVSLETQQSVREEWRATLDAVTVGAQASLQSAYLLHGSPADGIAGFIPTMERWKDSVDEWRRAADKADEDRYREMQGEFSAIRSELASVKARQSVIRRCVLKVGETLKPVIESQWKVLLVVAIGWAAAHVPMTYSVKRFLEWISSLLSQHAK